MNNFKYAVFAPTYAEIWNRIIYYGLQATLVIYLINVIGLSDVKSYQLYGTYTALTLGFSIFGGVLADKILGYYYAVVVGSLFVILGNVILCYENINAVFIGISSIAVGVGLFKPNNSSILGEVIQHKTCDKGKVFSIFYLFINIGGLIGPVLYGYFIGGNLYQYCHVITSIGMLSAIFLLNKFCFQQKHCLGIRPNVKVSTVFLIMMLIGFAVVLSSVLIRYDNLINLALISLFLGNCYLIIRIASSVSKEERDKLKLIIVPMVCSIVYFAFLLQIYTSVTTYINRYVDKVIFGINIPTPWFSSLEPLFLIISVPLLTSLWNVLGKNNISLEVNKKILLGLFLSSISFVFFSLATLMQYNSILNITFILIANFMLAMAELCVIPLSISLVNSVSPGRYKSTIMGIFYSSLAISGYLSGLIAKLTTITKIQGSYSYTFTFSFISILILTFLVVIVLIDNCLRKSCTHPL